MHRSPENTYQPLGVGPGSTIERCYHVEQVLGTGPLATEYLVRENEGREHRLLTACHPESMAALSAESRRTLDSTLGIRSEHLFCHLRSGTSTSIGYYLVTELPAGPTLGKVLSATDGVVWETIKSIGSSLSDALRNIHDGAIVHGNIHTGNVFVQSDGRIKLGPVEIRLFERQAICRGPRMPIVFIPPEIFGGSGPTPAGDCYSLSILLFRLLTGRYPFDGTTPELLRANVLKTRAQPPHRINIKVPVELSELVARALDPTPSGRPTIQSFCDYFGAPSPAQELIPIVATLNAEPPAPVLKTPPPLTTLLFGPDEQLSQVASVSWKMRAFNAMLWFPVIFSSAFLSTHFANVITLIAPHAHALRTLRGQEAYEYGRRLGERLSSDQYWVVQHGLAISTIALLFLIWLTAFELLPGTESSPSERKESEAERVVQVLLMWPLIFAIFGGAIGGGLGGAAAAANVQVYKRSGSLLVALIVTGITVPIAFFLWAFIAMLIHG